MSSYRTFPRRLITGAVILLALAPAAALAQSAPVGDDPVAKSLFEPELIMKHRRAIALSDEQRDAISRLIRELQGQVVSLQWELQEQAEALGAELAKPRVDLDRAKDRLDRVMQTERRIKEAHLTLLIRIKNLLTPQQQAALAKLRAEPPTGPGDALSSSATK
ncbi:MAG: Spy/CpxP family protein refolding chaperone [Gemmatimonadaceae bacterium]